MGIDTHYYTMHGIKTEWDDEFTQAYDDVYDDNDTPCVLLECITGEYMIFGNILYDSGNLRWGDMIDSFVEINIDKLGEQELEYKKQFISKFPQFEKFMQESFKLMTFVHYS